MQANGHLVESIFHAGKIVDSNDMCDLEPLLHQLLAQYQPSDILGCFDLDNTLIMYTDLLCRNQNHEQLDYMIKQAQAQQKNVNLLQKFMLQDEAFMSPQLVDENAPALLNFMNQKGIPCLGITARAANQNIAQLTLTQIAKLNLKMNGQQYAATDLSHVESALFTANTLFCGNNHKDKMLDELFKKRGSKPKVLIMMDDQRYNLEDIQAYCKKEKIDFYGIRATRWAKHGISPKAEALQIQFNVMKRGKWLPTEKAIESVEYRKKLRKR